ncbi:MAG: acyl-CoA thioesterase [Bacteroidetes bacterium]|nr:acyl-CoA thioesterase [Bacteroidota bacterium]MCL5268576.1 acyl-CoA thioesterase [Bacteroidota bacterium]
MPIDRGSGTFSFKYSREVKTYEIDIQQVVHNVIYFYYFEEARIEYLKRLGFQLKKEIIIDGVEFVVAHNEADYHEAARLGDQLTIFARISKIGRTSFTFDLKIVREDGAEMCSGRTTVVAVEKGSGRPTPIPDHMRKAMEAFEGAKVNAAAD